MTRVFQNTEFNSPRTRARARARARRKNPNSIFTFRSPMASTLFRNLLPYLTVAAPSLTPPRAFSLKGLLHRLISPAVPSFAGDQLQCRHSLISEYHPENKHDVEIRCYFCRRFIARVSANVNDIGRVPPSTARRRTERHWIRNPKDHDALTADEWAIYNTHRYAGDEPCRECYQYFEDVRNHACSYYKRRIQAVKKIQPFYGKFVGEGPKYPL